MRSMAPQAWGRSASRSLQAVASRSRWPCPQRPCSGWRAPPPAAAAAAGATPGSSGSTSPSSGQSELVTRTLLGSAGALCSAGLPPGAVAAFSSGGDAAVGGEPTCNRCRIEPLSGEDAEQLSDVLLGLGAQSVVVEEYRAPGAAEQEVFGAESGLWDRCSVVAHFGLETDADAAMAAAWDILGGGESGGESGGGSGGEGLTTEGTAGGSGAVGWRYSVEPVVNAEWVDQIKASYVPLQIIPPGAASDLGAPAGAAAGRGLYIVPSWSEPEDPGAVNIILEPGVAFGTGEHPTTRLCLGHIWSLRGALRGAAVVDYGSGSGVLAIAALLLGAGRAVGTDTDPLAVRAAARNAELSGVAGGFRCLQCSPDLEGPEPLAQAGLPAAGAYDLVVANILRGPLLELAPRLCAYAAPGARLALSGVLAEQVPDVRAAYAEAFEDFEVRTDGSWALVTARRRR
ncbi:ribosomal protein L11 methyltransferase [Raphidocelis subcapitata]|uniref:ETFB lysine methyltransferase n=1 Tax=Raphidocelis subcapitata TaxID=307507 RepID=A0A2V0P6Z8_9CHLO|nr:ribosomal protein L11 methyltransferase [Raphidocelis subcapitata]|eukprot:GBF95339.1 ribosomal protein L11 methyltransferase [Raphidocelis subcapitata]